MQCNCNELKLGSQDKQDCMQMFNQILLKCIRISSADGLIISLQLLQERRSGELFPQLTSSFTLFRVLLSLSIKRFLFHPNLKGTSCSISSPGDCWDFQIICTVFSESQMSLPLNLWGKWEGRREEEREIGRKDSPIQSCINTNKSNFFLEV